MSMSGPMSRRITSRWKERAEIRHDMTHADETETIMRIQPYHFQGKVSLTGMSAIGVDLKGEKRHARTQTVIASTRTVIGQKRTSEWKGASSEI
jgi:hypothetical protein